MSREKPPAATATHFKIGKWTPTKDGKNEIFVVKRTKAGMLAHVRKRIVDKPDAEIVELTAEVKT